MFSCTAAVYLVHREKKLGNKGLCYSLPRDFFSMYAMGLEPQNLRCRGVMPLFQSTFMGFSCLSIPSAILCCKSMGNSRSDIFIFLFYLLFMK
jgi:hypothetical protein